jgi:hypothetical protein
VLDENENSPMKSNPSLSASVKALANLFHNSFFLVQFSEKHGASLNWMHPFGFFL